MQVRLFRRGDSGPAVVEIRAKLARLGYLAPAVDTEMGVGPRGYAGPATASGSSGQASFDEPCEYAVRSFQQARGLSADGIVGPETYRALDEARWRLGDRLLFHAVSHPFVGDDVAELQQRLLDMGFDPGRGDGVLGRSTAGALREFQRNVGLQPDGTCGPATLDALARLTRTVRGGHPQGMRESERLHRAGPALPGKLIVVDPGHGGADCGAVGHGLTEAALVFDVAQRLEGRLAATGVSVFLTRGGGGAPTDAERASFANAVGADLVISLHVDSNASPQCRGVATYFYGWREAGPGGGPGSGSAVGERLAGLVQSELVARTGLLDCRSHPKTWELLRRTKMPTVRIELGYVSSPADAPQLAETAFRDAAADAVLIAIQRLYLPPDLDAPTGQLRLADIAAAGVG